MSPEDWADGIEITLRHLLTHTSGLMSSGASAAMVSQVPIGPGEPLSVVIPRLKNVPLPPIYGPTADEQ